MSDARNGRHRTARAAASVGLLACVGGSLAWATTSPPPSPRPAATADTAVPIDERTWICPEAGGASQGGAAWIAYADPATGDGQLAVGPLDPARAPAPADVHPGNAWTTTAPASPTPVRIDGRGPLAMTFAALQVTREVVGSGAVQLASTPCQPPTTDAWFLGASTQAGAQATLVLANPDDTPASVDVGLFDDTDPPNPQAARGVRVPGMSQVTVPIDQLEPNAAVVAVHVTTESGRVVAGLRYALMNGQVPLGREWIPQTGPPASELVVPGLAGGDGPRKILLANPGELDATASLRVVGPDGSFTPTGFDQVTVAAGQTVAVDVEPALHQQPAAIVINSDQPLIAGSVIGLPASSVGAADVAFGAAVPALTGSVAVAGAENVSDKRTTLLLSAPSQDAVVRLEILRSLPGGKSAQPTPGPSPSAAVTIAVPAGTSKSVELATLTKDPAPGLELTVESGSVYGALIVHEAGAKGDGLTAFPLRTLPGTRDRPPAYADLQVGEGGGGPQSSSGQP